MLYKESDNNKLQTNVDSVQHLHIHNANIKKQFMGYFKNAIELTLPETFDIHRHSIVDNLNRIITLQQLIKLTINCYNLPFEQMIELLQFTSNINTLKFNSMLLSQIDSISIQQNDVFKLVSKMNIVTNLTIEKEITLKQIQLLVVLFSRLEYLKIDLSEGTFKSIIQFLLSKSNDNTRYLSSLCISKQDKHFMEILTNLLESEKLLDDYTLKVINCKLYLWW